VINAGIIIIKLISLIETIIKLFDNNRNPNSSQTFPEFDYYGSCPIASYYWSNFLAIQGIVEGTWLKV